MCKPGLGASFFLTVRGRLLQVCGAVEIVMSSVAIQAEMESPGLVVEFGRIFCVKFVRG